MLFVCLIEMSIVCSDDDDDDVTSYYYSFSKIYICIWCFCSTTMINVDVEYTKPNRQRNFMIIIICQWEENILGYWKFDNFFKKKGKKYGTFIQIMNEKTSQIWSNFEWEFLFVYTNCTHTYKHTLLSSSPSSHY